MCDPRSAPTHCRRGGGATRYMIFWRDQWPQRLNPVSELRSQDSEAGSRSTNKAFRGRLIFFRLIIGVLQYRQKTHFGYTRRKEYSTQKSWYKTLWSLGQSHLLASICGCWRTVSIWDWSVSTVMNLPWIFLLQDLSKKSFQNICFLQATDCNHHSFSTFLMKLRRGWTWIEFEELILFQQQLQTTYGTADHFKVNVHVLFY